MKWRGGGGGRHYKGRKKKASKGKCMRVHPYNTS